ncbi:MAG: heme-dependent oxidative N-demethylase subunit alpha family protein [Pseudomonadota bacterium]
MPFTGLQPGRILERFNWTIQAGDARYTPQRPSAEGAGIEDLHLRVERQTIRKPSSSGAVVFTIRICMDPLLSILANPDWRDAFEDAWLGAPEPVRKYKGWADLEPLVAQACRRAAYAL